MRRELYLSILMDRASGGPVIVASSKGGTSIEDIAAATPELIVTAPVDIVEGLTDATVDKVVSSLGFRAGDEDGVRVLPTMRTPAPPRCYSPRLTSIVMFRQRTCSATCTSCSSTPMPPWSRSTRSPRRRTATVRRELAVGGWCCTRLPDNMHSCRSFFLQFSSATLSLTSTTTPRSVRRICSPAATSARKTSVRWRHRRRT